MTTLHKTRGVVPEVGWTPPPPFHLARDKEYFHGFFLHLPGPGESIGFPKAPAGGVCSGYRGAGHPGKAGMQHVTSLRSLGDLGREGGCREPCEGWGSPIRWPGMWRCLRFGGCGQGCPRQRAWAPWPSLQRLTPTVLLREFSFRGVPAEGRSPRCSCDPPLLKTTLRSPASNM